MGKYWNKFKQSVANEYHVPSYKDPAAQSVRNMAVYATLVEVAAFLFLGIDMALNDMYWESRGMIALLSLFACATILYGIRIAEKISKEPLEEGKVPLMKKGMLSAVAIMVASIAVGIMVRWWMAA